MRRTDADQLAEGGERLVADGVAGAVVDLLELVQVDEHERERDLVAGCALDLAVELLLEGAVVAEAGQRVAQRVGDRLLVADLQVGARARQGTDEHGGKAGCGQAGADGDADHGTHEASGDRAGEHATRRRCSRAAPAASGNEHSRGHARRGRDAYLRAAVRLHARIGHQVLLSPEQSTDVSQMKVAGAVANKYRPSTRGCTAAGCRASATMGLRDARTSLLHRPHRTRGARLPDRPGRSRGWPLADRAQPRRARGPGRDGRRGGGRERLAAPQDAGPERRTSGRVGPRTSWTSGRPPASTC